MLSPEYIFETSWEVCNKIGGIYTVISTKAPLLVNKLGENYITIGPDVLRDEINHPEFEEDSSIFSEWVQKASSDGLRIRVGRWKIESSPVAILVDFSSYINSKDTIFAKFWEKFGLDSLSGQWDYIEPVLFGYAVGKVIEHFVKSHSIQPGKTIAQFHEWMTGSGILYLADNIPTIATIFTTHATVLGRSLAGNNRPLYRDLDKFAPIQTAKEINVTSKDSIERLAAQHADSFTTVSEITGRECSKLLEKRPDIITPNGFDSKLILSDEEFTSQRNESRQTLLKVASALCNEDLHDESTMFIGTSGRYEFKNKGIDLFIKALGNLNKEGNLNNKRIIAFFFIPTYNYGARKDLICKLDNNSNDVLSGNYITHKVHDLDFDPIISSFKKEQLFNDFHSNVKVIFVPSYLNGNDGVFNMHYYKMLTGLDLTIFPSYYEPWGYTPMESIAYRIPTVTTSLAGFGLWINSEHSGNESVVKVIDRTDDNAGYVIDEIKNHIKYIEHLNEREIETIRNKALEIAKQATWENFIDEYSKAFDIALTKTKKLDTQQKPVSKQTERVYRIQAPDVNPPIWKRLLVQSKLPKKLAIIKEIISNLWWSWDCEAIELFENIDPVLWDECGQNPILLFEQLEFKKLKELENDKDFVSKLDSIYKRFKDYLNDNKKEGPEIAYFSMEFGLHKSLKIYSGGLGILAGDYLKEASDSKINIVAIGLLYRYGYFNQLISIDGEQIVSYESEIFSKIPIEPVKKEDGAQLTITVAFPGRILKAKIWKVAIGRVSLYLLDTDSEENQEGDRFMTHHLYGGDHENRLKQELLLGVGGIRALKELNIQPDLYHSNEGHSAFIGLERLRRLINEENLTFPEAKEVVRASTLFTTHTPVPAGHDEFTEELLRTYISHYPGRLKIGWDELMALGKSNPNDPYEKFNMSHLASRLSQEVNGVSMLHGKVSRDMFAKLWPGYLVDELHIKHVTNGVHYPTWTSKLWRRLYRKYFGEDFEQNQLNKELWAKIYDVPDQEIWDVKQHLRTILIDHVKDRFKDTWTKRHENPRHIVEIIDTLDDKALTIGFARRFATYKRAHLLFNNIERLAEIVNNPDAPVQFLFAGKAHPHDGGGQGLIKHIVEISKRPEFLGKILFLQNYDMELARKLVQGVDIWLNTPTRPLEASGTSGEKGVMNGTLHFSVLDGWWVEGYEPDAGWALPLERTYENQEFQDRLDAETIYSLLENEITPAFYERDKNGVSKKWVKYMKNCIAHVAPKFTTTRMITDYNNLYYLPLSKRSGKLNEGDYLLAKDIAYWKKHISHEWDRIDVISADILSNSSESYQMGIDYEAKVVLDLKLLDPGEIGVEIIITENFYSLLHAQEFNIEKIDGTEVHYVTKLSPPKPGIFNYGLRIYPKSDLLPHRQDFGYLKWI